MATHSLASRSFTQEVKHPVLLALMVGLVAALWMLFVATTNPHEIIIGILTTGATATFTFVVCRSSSSHLTLRLTDLKQCWRIPWYILSGVCEITWVLLKDLVHMAPAENLFRVCGFDSSAHDPIRMARTVLAVAYTTTAPNFIVVGIDVSQSRMLFHQIAPSSVPLMTKALGAKS